MYPPAVFVGVRSFDSDDGVDGLAAGIHEGRYGQLQLPDDGVLGIEVGAVALDEGVAVLGDVLVLHALAVEGIEAYPCARVSVIVAEHGSDIVVPQL